MKNGVAMADLDWFGSEGGRLAAAFGTGAAACFTFIMAFVYIAFRFVTRSHEERLAAAEAAHEECRRLSDEQKKRIEALELMLFVHGPTQIRKELGPVISELHMDVRRIEREGGKS